MQYEQSTCSKIGLGYVRTLAQRESRGGRAHVRSSASAALPGAHSRSHFARLYPAMQ